MNRALSPEERFVVLVDRAARRLLPDEGELLRAGFAALEAARKSAGGLQAQNQRLRAELAAALSLLAADAPSGPTVTPQGAAQGFGGGIPAGDAPGPPTGRSVARLDPAPPASAPDAPSRALTAPRSA